MKDEDLHKGCMFLESAKLLPMNEKCEKQDKEVNELLDNARDLLKILSESRATPPLRVTVEIRVEDGSPQVREMLTNYLFLDGFWRKETGIVPRVPK